MATPEKDGKSGKGKAKGGAKRHQKVSFFYLASSNLFLDCSRKHRRYYQASYSPFGPSRRSEANLRFDL
jgi:hypothetical protein